MSWSVYVLCSEARGHTYVGISTDPERRLRQHNGELPVGAKSTRSGRPWEIGALYGPYEDRSIASRIEHEVKRRTGSERLALDTQGLLAALAASED